jgi:tetratricopeptide (TPR) repeat protein
MAESGGTEKTGLQRFEERPKPERVWGSDRMLKGLVAVAVVMWSTAALAAEPDPVVKSEQQQVAEASHLIGDQKPADAVILLDKVIAANEARHQDKAQRIYCGRSPEEVLMYMLESAAAKRSAVALDPSYCDAVFLKGYALIDLNRADEARAYLDKAIALAPQNAQYLAERGEWYKNRKDWASAYKDFESAASAAAFAPDQVKSSEQRRGWRGMAYVRTEQGKLGEARALLQKCLKLDSSDDKCQHELDYVNGLPAKSN